MTRGTRGTGYGFRPVIRWVVGIAVAGGAAFFALPGLFARDKSIATWVWIAAVLAWVGVFALILFRSATVIWPDGIVFRGAVRTRSLTWPEVQAITIEFNAASLLNSDAPTHRMVVYDRSNRRIASAHVTSQNVDFFELTVAGFQAAWRQGRGADWVAIPEVQQRVAARQRRWPGQADA